MKKKIRNSKGFTIVELIIATSVFGVMLLIATTAMLQIGKAYFKGVTTSKTQEIARSINDEIAHSVQLGGTSTIRSGSNNYGGFQVNSYCVGSIRYSYVLDKALGATSLKHGLWVDVLQNSGVPCTALDLRNDDPSAGDASTSATPEAVSQRRELLGTRMRLSRFNLSASSTSAAYISSSIKIMYGEDDVIKRDDLGPGDDGCNPIRLGGQFCAFSQLDTIVKTRQ